MRRYIILLLITGIVWSQTEFDKLVLKDGTTYLGEYSKTEKQIVYFKPQNAFAFQPVPVQLIKRLRLKEFQPVPIKLIKFIKLKDGSVPIYLGRELTLPVAINRKIGNPVWDVCGIMILIFGLMFWEDLKDIDLRDGIDPCPKWPEKGP